MKAIDPIILTLILLVPLAGAILVALAPDRAKLPNWIALLTSLVTFVLTLHLPAHFIAGQRGFQFEVNIPWIESPAICYHVGVDGLSLWLIVLVGLLAPIGVVASWNAIHTRRKVFYSLFLVQQTAMFGVFVALRALRLRLRRPPPRQPANQSETGRLESFPGIARRPHPGASASFSYPPHLLVGTVFY